MSGKKYVIYLIAFSIAGGIYALIYGKIEKHRMATLPSKYVYDPSGKSNTIVQFIRNLKYQKEYMDYVHESLAGKDKIPINFPYQNILPGGEKIYIRKYLADSILVEFYDPTYHHRLWGFRTGYLYRGFIHDTLKIE